jgi:nitrogen fixation/metabolism regulation signal transduction histidine kinase
MVLLSEASEALRKEERTAWQRVIRVLSHEINNSLAPIKSIARTLDKLSKNISFPDDIKENFRLGLEVIGSRAESLNRFLQSYAQLAKLPPPTRHNVPLGTIIERVVRMESRLPITLVRGPSVTVFVDPDQLEHALINLIKNAVEAVMLSPGAESRSDAVTVSWKTTTRDLTIRIQDRGVGLSNTENLFVPFYTTKESGTGIGLLLSRQVVEAHAGTLRIHNREDAPGCDVEIILSQCIARESHNVR